MRSRILAGVVSLLAGAACLILAPGAEAAPRKRPAAKKTAAKKSPVKRTAAKTPAAPLTQLAGVTRVEIAPASGTLEGSGAKQHLVVTAATKDGATHDVTDRVTFSLTDSRVAKLSGGVLYPVSDGETRITAKLGKLTSVPAAFTVVNAKAPASIEFVNDIMPILTKAGCNMTACHGSPAGKGGLKLSLFGYEPELDHPAIVKDADGRRVDPKNPAKSLILTKPTMAVPHAGGQRFKPDSPEYRTLLAWLKEGAPGVGELVAHVRKVEVIPEQPWLPKPGARQRLAVTAYLSDGTTRDVTEKVVFSSNDDAIADVDGRGTVTAKRPGETAIMVRYLGQVGLARVAVLPPWPSPAPETYQKLPKGNYIDELVQAKLQKLRVLPSDPCTDEEFIRRATLDTCGIIPTVEEVRAFVADRSPNKRAKLIDRLLERPEFVDLWTMRWNDTLRNNPRLTRVGTPYYARWIREQLEKNRPYDEWVRELLTATGKTADMEVTVAMLPPAAQSRPNAQFLVNQVNRAEFNPAANYFAVNRDPLDTTSATSQIFLGVRIECARCHNHPFEKWTQNDYFGLAAFFTGIQARGQNRIPAVVAMNNRAAGPRHPKTNEVVEPKLLDDAEVKLARGDDKRAALAAWMTSPENPFFTRAAVNRLWGHYFGRGIVEPIDDFRATNPPSNPELLDALARDFATHGFDLKRMHRTILTSRTYQQSSRPNETNRQDTSNFARYYPKRMMAEQLYDSISQATGIFLNMPGRGGRGRRPQIGGALARLYRDALPAGELKRVMQLPAVAGRGLGGDLGVFLDTFGKPRREVVCECERSAEGNMTQALALINGNEVNDKIAAPAGRVQQLIRSEKPETEVIEELYLAVLSRRPNSTELNEATGLLRSAGSRAEGIEDLAWSLLNAREFLFVH